MTGMGTWRTRLIEELPEKDIILLILCIPCFSITERRLSAASSHARL